MEVVVDPSGHLRCVYEEMLDLSNLGHAFITRASHVEPDQDGNWHVDLAPVGGPQLGPFTCRSLALAAETDWLVQHWLISKR